MKVSELLRSLADMVAQAEGGQQQAPTAVATLEPVQAQSAQHFEPEEHEPE